MPIEMTTLYYKDAGSDKVYQASIDQTLTGYVVNFAFGRRGTTLKAGCKTSGPVDLPAAKKIYEKLLAEKKAKGYQAGANGASVAPAAPTTTNSGRTNTGNLPQLLNPIGEDALESMMKDDSFWMQQKHDGHRVMIEKTKFSVIASNKQGLSAGLSSVVENAVKEISVYRNVENFVLDGEMIGDEYFVFDVLQCGGKDLRDLSYSERHAKLLKLIPIIRDFPINLVFTAFFEDEKRLFLERMRKEKAEGVVFKKHAAKHSVGRPGDGGPQLKCKFYETCSCVVMDKPTGKKQSVWLQMLNDQGQWEPVGKCTIPINYSVPTPGKIVEIKYLYAYKGGSLYQPIYLGERDDVDASECSIKQQRIKYKPEKDSDEDDDA